MTKYQIYVQQIMKYLLNRKLCPSSRASHQKCYDELGEYLMAHGLEYSDAASDQWLNAIKNTHNRQKCYFWRQYVQQLIAFINTGSIPDELFYQIRSFYEKIPASLKEPLDRYLDSCQEKYSKRCFELARVHCSRIMVFLSSHSVKNLADITFSSIDSLYSADLHCSSETRFVLLSHARMMFAFFSDQGLCLKEYSMLLDDRIYPQIGNPDNFSKEHRLQLEALRLESLDFPPDEFLEAVLNFRSILKTQGYQQTQLKSSEHILRALYLFLVRYGFGYLPEISWIWFEEIRITLGSSWKNWRRLLRVFQQYTEDGSLVTDIRYTYKCDLIETFPEWCRIPVSGFLEQLIREFRSENTARNYKFSCLRFCRFLLDKEINSFKTVTLEHIRIFSFTDPHETPYGRSTSFAVIKRFLYYLEEQGLVSGGIHQGLFPGAARSTEITDILTDDQIDRIYEYRTNAASPMEFRNSAIVTAGLELGLRASDVANLKYSDIDWPNKSISIIQKKTGVGITLPLSNSAGNSFYRYLRYGRPATDSSFFFVHHRAPYSGLTTKICNNALYSILPERREIHHKGFHVMRRTFATRILRNNAGIGGVMDSLGHTDPTSVMKYLSFDDNRIRMCPLSLAECGIPLKGGML